MNVVLFKSKIHRARVTEADLNYMGSLTIDRKLMDAAGIIPHEQVHVVNNSNGARFVTYAIEGKEDSGVICVNGAASRLVSVGDIIIIIAYTDLSLKEAREFSPKIVHVDQYNKEIKNPQVMHSIHTMYKSSLG